MDLEHLNEIEQASRMGRLALVRLGGGVIFIVGVMLYAASLGDAPGSIMLMAVAVIGGYMAMNIGANDVANNVGPAVGAKALSLAAALVVAAIFETAGALVAGGAVIDTIRSGIIEPGRIRDADTFVWLMTAALLAGALWINIATAVGAPVSTTHSIVGAVLGAGIAASGVDVANWDRVSTITAGWVVSPVLSGLIAAAMLYLVKRSITYQPDMVGAARRMVPLLVALMAWVFAAFLLLKGFNRLWPVGFPQAMAVGFAFAVPTYLVVRPLVAARTRIVSNTKQSVNRLFTAPLVVAAALLSFAHGSNDVANVVGPLAAVVDVLAGGGIGTKAAIPWWVMMVGALGIAVGLALFGPRVIATVGSEITELDQMRAFCIAIATTVTVIAASQFGLPVSTTHTAVGAVFGIGFLREYLKGHYARMVAEIKAHHPAGDQAAIDAFLGRFSKVPVEEKGRMLRDLKLRSKMSLDPANFSKAERKGLRRIYHQQLVKRNQLMRIVTAWIVTVPASALIGALLYFTIRGMMLP